MLGKHHTCRVMKCETHNTHTHTHTGSAKLAEKLLVRSEKKLRHMARTCFNVDIVDAQCMMYIQSKWEDLWLSMLLFLSPSSSFSFFPFWLSCMGTIPESIFRWWFPGSHECMTVASNIRWIFNFKAHCFDGSGGGYSQIQHSKLPFIFWLTTNRILYVRTGYSLDNDSTLSGETHR